MIKMTEQEKKEMSCETMIAFMEIKRQNGEPITDEVYETARQLGMESSERKSKTLWGQIRHEWSVSKKELVKSLFKGIRGIFTALITGATLFMIAWGNDFFGFVQ